MSLAADPHHSTADGLDAFSYPHTDLFPTLLNRKLIYMMPDLVDMPSVQVDASMTLIYYCILWHGTFIPTANHRELDSLDAHYARVVFLCCLRTIPHWLSEVTGTVLDFVAAMCIVS